MKQTKLPKIDEQIRIAKSLVGKYIKSISNNGVGMVERYEIYTELDRQSQFSGPNYLNSRLNQSLKTHGVFVGLRGTWSSGSNMLYAVPDNPVVVKTCRINGHVGVDHGDYYLWGCAKIEKDILRNAKVLLETPMGAGNRSVESVTIGRGTFTLNDLLSLELE